MRLFAAIDPPADEVARLAAALGEPLPALRYVPSEQWHVTTAFYGDVPDAVVPELVERLGRAAARTPAMTLSLHGVGTFPKQSVKARVLWVGLDADVPSLSRLAERCIAAGRRCGLAMEARPFRPHLTVARVRREPVDLRAVVAELSSYAGASWSVTSLRLVRSTVGAQVRHETLHAWTIGGPQG
jgi:2'-5' RNA ligase